MLKRGPEPEQRSAKKARTSTQPRVQVSQLEWNIAKTYFKLKQRVKLSRKKHKGIKHSFIKIRNQLIALANKKSEGKKAILGEGAFGIVKLAENEKGKDYALKIEAGKKRAFDNSELKVLEKVPNYYHGQAERSMPKKAYRGAETCSKLYTLMELLEGKELEKQLNILNDVQKLLVAVKSCLAIRELHQNNIIHADIKPANFMAKICKNDIVVRAIDFGFSMLLKPGQKIILEEGWKGTPAYMAPEAYAGKYSVQSDIYALGSMFKNDLYLPERLYQNMLRIQPAQRSSLDEVMHALLNELDMVAKDNLQLKEQVRDMRVELMIPEPKPSAGFLAHWQHFYTRVANALQEPLTFLCKGALPANR